jgi:AcrR family transcriptional regulator
MNASKKEGATATSGLAKKQERAILTRKQLTDAARQIFASRGFELSSVEEIAAAAGKTRGAFYANFKEDLARDRERVSLHLSEASSSEERIGKLALHLREVIKDKPRMLLALEFKLYAIRHPRRQKRLADLHASMCAQCMEADLDRLLPEFAAAGADRKRTQSAQFGAILDGLALNCMFAAGSLSEEQVLRLIQSNLRVVLGTEQPTVLAPWR